MGGSESLSLVEDERWRPAIVTIRRRNIATFENGGAN
jgi:hypothetical protein